MSFLQVNGLSKTYSTADGGVVQAVCDLSFSIDEGQVLGVVGESGCGKSTLGLCLLRLIEPSSGKIRLAGLDIDKLSRRQMKPIRRICQIIFQDPFGSLNPRHTVNQIVGEPLVVHNLGTRVEQQRRVRELLQLVGLAEDAGRSYPHEFSGGQRQRIAIARALALKPKFIVADEAVSALDVSIQSQIINLLVELQKRLSITILFISHDLSVIRHVSDRIAVMYLGRIVEIGEADAVIRAPLHPYTKALISAIPHLQDTKSQRIVLQGELPDPANPPAGCAFHTRCSHAIDECKRVRPKLVSRRHADSPSREIACHLYALD